MLTPEQKFIIGPQAPIGSSWYDTTLVARAKYHGRNFPASPPTGEAVNAYTDAHYYDLGKSLAICYERTGDPEFLTLFRKVQDSWWLLPNWTGAGKVREFGESIMIDGQMVPQGTSPKFAGVQGLILRALDGRPEMWDWIHAFTRYELDLWVKSRINDSQLYLGPREGAFCTQDAILLAAVLPDSFPLTAGGTATNGAVLRAQLLADVEAIVLNYWDRLQYPDGSWRWDDPYWSDPEDATSGMLVGIMQPFMIGLVLDALIDVYRITTNSAVKASILTQVTKACRHLYSDGPYSTQLIPVFGVRLRGFHYLYHGGTEKNPTRFAKGDLPADFANWKPEWDVQNQRQPIGTMVSAYGWCYERTGDLFFKQAGDELWDSAYGDTDGIRNYMTGAKGKDFNQNVRSASKYLAWAGEVQRPLPLPPQPTPTPQPPAPEPVKTPSPDGTKAAMIIDSQLATWTIGPNKETLRNGTPVGGGQATSYKYLNALVFAWGDIGEPDPAKRMWYRWSDSGQSWSWFSRTEPGVAELPPPLPPPIPEPPPPVPPPPVPPAPTPPRTITYPSAKQLAKRNAVLEAQRKEGYYLFTENANGTATFQKVTP